MIDLSKYIVKVSKQNKSRITPLKRSTASFQDAKLSFSDSWVKITPHAANYLFFGIFLVVGLAVIILSQTGMGNNDTPDKIFAIIFGGFFGIIGLSGMFYPKFSAKAEIDLLNKKFYPKGKRKFLSTINPQEELEIPLERFKFLRILTKTGRHSKGGTYHCYELNLVIDDDHRYNLLNHGKEKKLLQDAQKLSEILNLPLLNENNEEYLTSEKKKTLKIDKKSGWILIMFSAVWLLISSVGGYHLVAEPFFKYFSSANWEIVPAEVISSEILKDYDDGKFLYALKILYSYNFHGEVYQSDNYDFFRHGSSYSNIGVKDLHKIRNQYPVGKKFSCRVNPKNPKEATIARTLPSIAYFSIIFIGVFWGISLIIFWFGLKGITSKENKSI